MKTKTDKKHGDVVVGSTALLGSVIDCAAFLRRPERKKAGTLIVMRPGVTPQQVVDAALEIGMAIRYAKKEEMKGRGGVMFLVLPNVIISHARTADRASRDT